MSFKQLFLFAFIPVIFGCAKGKQLNKIEGKRIEINETMDADMDIDAFLTPYRERVTNELDSVLAYAKETYSKSDGELNTAIGNFMADLVRERGNLVYTKRTGNAIDMVMLNHGGIRSIISAGDVTVGDAYKVMPFENSIVVIEMKGKTILEGMIPYLIRAKRAHPISGLRLHINEAGNVLLAEINGEAIDADKTYHVATNDYLYFGGDRMNFFKEGSSMTPLDYKIRNAIIDHLATIDTVQPIKDDRFILK